MENILNNLNTFLSDLNVFYRKLQNYHWNIKGKDFFVVHPKLEEYYTEVNSQIDEIAEHILALGGQPLGTLKDYLNTTKITEAENKKVDSTLVYNELIKDYTKLLQDVKNIKNAADEEGEHKTSAMMDDIIENYTSKIWMLKQNLE
ncbi:MAG: Dps family protein [Clostridia bacterium]